MRVLHVISCLVKADGHSAFCLRLAECLSGPRSEQKVFTLPAAAGQALPDPQRLVHYAEGRVFRLLNIGLLFGIGRQFAALVRSYTPDVVHVHGGWHPLLFCCARVAKRMGLPVVLSLHGSLRPAVVEGDPRIKKRLAWRLYQRRLPHLADVIHASSESEAEDSVRLGIETPVAVVPIGVDAGACQERADLRPLGRRVLGCHEKQVVLYLSRIHPLKGLDLLLSAWNCVAAEFPDWQLVIAGPDEQGTQAKLVTQAEGLGFQVVVDGEPSAASREQLEAGDPAALVFCGPVYGEEKQQAMAVADLVVLPTRSENFGLVVAEALAAGVPVITTTGAPWAELESCRCGWWVDVGAEPLAAALREAMGLTDTQRRVMGENGRRLVERKYRWEKVAEAMARVYENLDKQSV